MAMYKSIKETQKSFRIEGLEGGQVNIRTSKYLLSLPEEEQIKALSDQRERLKEDLASHETILSQKQDKKADDVDKVIQVRQLFTDMPHPQGGDRY